MARRRSLNRRRSRRSFNTSGILNDDTNVYEEDDDLWFKRIPDESNISKYRDSRYSSSVLNPDSDVYEGLDDEVPYWKLLNSTSQDLLPGKKASSSPNKSARKSNTMNETLTSESSTIPPLKKRKLLASKSRKSTGDVFSQALDDSGPAIESEPAPLADRFLPEHRKSLSQSAMADRTGFQSSESETDRRDKRTIFKKPRRTSTGTSRVSLYEKVLDETELSAVGPSQPAQRRTFIKPRTTLSNSSRYSSQDKANSSQRSSYKDLESDSDLDLATQQRPLFRQRAKQHEDPFASIISESGSEKDGQTQKSLDHSVRSIQLESQKEEILRSRRSEEKDNGDNKSITSGSKSNRSSDNFVLHDSVGENSVKSQNSKRSRALSVNSNKSSTTSISETFKSLENLSLDYESNPDDPQDLEAIEENSREEPMETEEPIDQAVDPSQSQETFGRASTGEAELDEDEEVVDKENRESLHNIEEDNVSLVRSSPKKSLSPKKGKNIRITSDVIIATQNKDTSGELSERRRTRQSESDSRKSPQVQKSLGRKTRSRKISEVDKLTDIEAEKSLDNSGRKTRSGRVIETEIGTPKKSLGNKSPGKRSKTKAVELEVEGTLNDSQRKTRSGRVFKELGGDSEEKDAERSRRFVERKKILSNIYGEDSESEDESPEVQVSEAKSLESKDESQNDKGSQKIVESQEDEEEISKTVENGGESQDIENHDGVSQENKGVSQEDEGVSQEDEEVSQEDEEVSLRVDNQEEDEEESQEVDNEKESQENERERNKTTTESHQKEKSKVVSSDEEQEEETESISTRKSLGIPKFASTPHLTKGTNLNKSDSEEMDEELDKYVRNTSKLSSLQKSKQKEINPTPNDLPFRESDNEENADVGEIQRSGATVLSQARPSVLPSTSNTRRVSKAVESNKTRGSQQFPVNQRSILSFFTNTTTQPSLHISTKPLASSDLMKQVSAKMKAMKKRHDESFAKKMEEEINASKAKPVIMPVKMKKVGAGLKKNVKAKEVDKAFVVNGVVYRKPRLPRPKHWATDRLYKFLWKKLEPKYELQTRIKSEKFVTELADIVEVIKKKKEYKDYRFMLEELLKKMAQLGIIVTRKDFYDFCYDFLPYEFREKVTPMLLPGGVHLVPFEPEKLNTPILRT